MLSWESLSQSSKYQSLSPDQQEKVRESYFNDFVLPGAPEDLKPEDIRASFDRLTAPKASPASGLASTMDAELGTSSPEPSAPSSTPGTPDRSWHEVGSDLSISLRKGGASLLKAGGWLADMANPATAAMRLRGDPTYAKEFSSSIDNVVAELEAGYSEKRKAQGAAYDKADGFTESALYLLQNPSFLGDMIAESAPGTAIAGGAGRIAGNIVARVSTTLEKKIAGEVAEKGAAWAAGATEAAQTFGQVAGEIEKSLDKNGITDAADRSIALAASLPASVLTLVFGRLGGNVEGKLFGKGFDEVGETSFKQSGKTIAKDVAKEGVLEEMPQSVAEQAFTNIGQRAAGDDIGITDGLGKAAAGGLIVGAAQGGGISALNEARKTASQVQLTGDFKTDIVNIAAAPVTPVVGAPSSTPADTLGGASPAPVVADAGAVGRDAAATATHIPQKPEVEDILRASDSQPFGSKSAAELEAQDRGLTGYTAVEVPHGEGAGFVLRKTIDAAANEAATSSTNNLSDPTDGQKDAGNYKLGHPRIGAIQMSVENPSGSTRSGTDASGKPWSTTMNGHYGYVKGSIGADSTAKKKQGSDLIVAENTSEDYRGPVFVIDQVREDGNFDEHKSVTGEGINTPEEARALYRSNYERGWDRDAAITQMSQEEYLTLVRDEKRARLPANPNVPVSSATDTDGTITTAATAPTINASRKEAPQDVEQAQQDAGDVTAVSVLNAAIQRAAERNGGAARGVALARSVPDSVSRRARQLGDLFGKRVVFVEGREGDAPFDGAVLKKQLPNHIFVDARAKRSPVAIAGHEALHLIQRERPELYEALKKIVLDNADAGAYAERFRARAEKQADSAALSMSEDAVIEEFVADLVGNRLLESRVMRALRGESPSKARELLDAVVDFFNRLIGRAKEIKGADDLVSDMERVRDGVVKTLAQYSSSTTEGAVREGQETDEPALKRNDAQQKISDRYRAAVHGARREAAGGFYREGLGDREGPRVRIAGQDTPVKQSFTPSPAARAELEAGGFAAPTLHEITGASSAFHTAISQAKAAITHGSSVYVYDEADYGAMRLFVNETGTSGFALKGDDIVSVFSTDGRGVANGMLMLAVQQGGRQLDAFDTVLPALYALHGFRAASRTSWSAEFAPPDWKPELYAGFNGGQPDVVFMVYDPSYFGEYDGEGRQFGPEGYDEAVAEQQRVKRELSEEPTLSRKDHAFSTRENARGFTNFWNSEVMLASPRLAETQPRDGLQRVAYDIIDPAIFRAELAKKTELVRAMARAKVGDLLIQLKRGVPAKFDNIVIYDSKRGQRWGEKVVRSLLATLPEGQTLDIIDIQLDADDFWRKMGARYPASQHYMEAKFGYDQYEKARGDGTQGTRSAPRNEGARDGAREGASTDRAGREGSGGDDLDFTLSRKRDGDVISTRNPSAKKASEDPVAQLLTVDVETMKRDPEMLAQNAKLLTSYHNLPTGTSRKSPGRIVDEFTAHVVENLLWLYDQVPTSIRERSKLWYVGANKIAADFAKEYGVSKRQAAGILAALSPQKDWFQNVDLARRTMDILANEQDRRFTPKMEKIARTKVLKEAFTYDGSDKAKRQLKLLNSVRGKKLSELKDNVSRAVFVRLFDEGHNPRSYPVVTPEGGVTDNAKTDGGAEQKVAWGDFGSIAKAVSMFYDDSIEHISGALGEEHKVRSFYNNIIDPMSEDGHVTIDTHAVAAGLLRPLAGGSIEVLHNFGNTIAGKPGPAGSKLVGLSGTYAIYADAYRRAAAARGVLAREMQSITWEAVRGLFPASLKKKGSAPLDTIAQLWQGYRKGKVSLNDVRQQTLAAAGGIRNPEWVGVSPAGLDAEEQRAADAGGVPRSGVPGRDAGGVDGGAGSAAAPGAAEADEGLTLSRKVTETPEFKAWFGDSKVVDGRGAPLVVYHGTKADFTEFGSWPIYTTPDAAAASAYATHSWEPSDGSEPAERVMPLYLSIQNPKVLTEEQLTDVIGPAGDRDWSSLENAAYEWDKQGYDGVHLVQVIDFSGIDGETKRRAYDQWLAFNPNQVKSAVGNNGTFNPTNSDIAFSRKDKLVGRVRDHVEAAFNTKRTFGLWERTVGTQIGKARKSPEFKRVFDKANEFIRDISYFAATAADKAPTLLPKLESIKSLGKGFSSTMTGERQKALAEAAALAYEGTLNKRTYTPRELQQRGVSEMAATFYAEARAAVDVSLEQTATSTMHRLARAMKLGVDGIRDMRMGEARKAITDVLRAKRDEVQSELANEQQLLKMKVDEYSKQLTPEAVAATLRTATEKVNALQSRFEELTKAIDDVNDMAGRVIDLQNEGYFPLMRFGAYTVYATQPGPDGKDQQLFFGMYETEADRVKMEANLHRIYPQATVRGGVANDQYYKLFAGINLDSLEVFAEAMGASEQAVFQSYLKLAVANRSALKRMIERKEVKGFDTDLARTLAHFLTSNARLASRNYHWAEAKSAALAIPKEKGDVGAEAAKLLKYIENPEEEAQSIRALNFLWFMAGNLSTAILNMTQPAMTTFPYLSRYGVGRAQAALAKGAKTLTGRGIDKELGKALKLAAEKGITAPHEIHNLYGEQQRTIFSRDTRVGAIWQRGVRLIGEPFALAEAFNRHVTFVAAYEIGRKLTPAELEKEGVADAFGFAMKTVDDTQFVYNKANRMNWGRRTVQSLIFQFKNYSISSVELFMHLARSGPNGKRAAALMLAMWLMAAGLLGLPYEEDLEDALDTLGQTLGFDTNIRASIRDSFTAGAEAILGKELGHYATELVLHGVSGVLPLDVQARLSLSNMIPATGTAKRSAADNRGKELLELLGPSGGLLQSMFEKIDAFQSGNASIPMSYPSFVRNVLQGIDMLRTGVYRDTAGRTVVETDSLDAFIKAVGFQPATVAQAQRKTSPVMEAIKLQRIAEKDFVERATRAMADAVLIGTPKAEARADAEVEKVFAEIERWNERNPDTPIEVKPAQLRDRLKGMLVERKVRIIKSAPREMRARVARELEDE